ncbi:major facilitator superfamily domain-containing protein [Xylogone sp. PMI_703]|nr:major facilitator superfamily domain-containing protein [Xylogone sp. PMI_703]
MADQTLQPQIIADTQFLHDRGAYNTLYFTFYFGSLMIGPIVSGAMALHVGWQNFWWLNVALFATLIVLLVFFFPETKWHRVHSDELGGHAGALPAPLSGNGVKEVETSGAKIENSTATNLSSEPVDEFLRHGYPSRHQLYLWSVSENPVRTLALTFFIPWKLHLYPIVEFASFVVSWSASGFLTLNLTQSQAFAAPPYNWSSQSIGFTNFAVLVGAFIGLLTNGPLSDWISMRSTIKNKGVREPEMRLPAMIPYVLIAILGNFIVAFGYQYSWDWRAIVIVGYTCAGIQVTALPAISSTYAVDSYKPVADSVFVAITVNKNAWGYGFSKFITPWIIKDGYIAPTMLNMCLIVLWCLFAIPFYFWGKQCRKWTAKANVHNMTNI